MCKHIEHVCGDCGNMISIECINMKKRMIIQFSTFLMQIWHIRQIIGHMCDNCGNMISIEYKKTY